MQGAFGQEARAVSLYTGLETRPLLRWGLMALLAGAALTVLVRVRPTRRWIDRISG